MITRVTGKHQITIPAEIAAKTRLQQGTRLDWRLTDRPDVLEVHVLPDISAVSESLRGRGKTLKRAGSAVDRLVAERELEESAHEHGSGYKGTAG